MWTRSDLKTRAKAHFKANYWPTVLVTLVFVFFVLATTSGTTAGQDTDGIIEGTSPVVVGALLVALVICIALSIFVDNAFAIGCEKFYLENGKETKPGFGTIAFLFKDKNYVHACLTIFVKDLFIALWSLLLVIPGIIKALEYYMVEFIVAENPGISYKEALAESKKMMNGNKWKAFVLDLSFILWDILVGIPVIGTLIAIFWVRPYKQQTEAELYLELKK